MGRVGIGADSTDGAIEQGSLKIGVAAFEQAISSHQTRSGAVPSTNHRTRRYRECQARRSLKLRDRLKNGLLHGGDFSGVPFDDG